MLDMLKVVIKTRTPEWCLIRRKSSTIFFKQIWLDKNSGVCALISYKEGNRNHTMIIKNHSCPLAEAILNSGAIVVSAEVKLDEITWVLACTQEEFKKLAENIKKLNFDYKLMWKSKFFEDSRISHREREILCLALSLGYFDTPRRVKLGDIAKLLGVSKATASELLRRALRKVVEEFIFE